jgi:hypothetical protein
MNNRISKIAILILIAASTACGVRSAATKIPSMYRPDGPASASPPVPSATPPSSNVPSAYPLGDLNCDGIFNNFDLDPFILAIVDRPGYDATFVGCDADVVSDFDGDGVLTNLDIDPFVNFAINGFPQVFP